MSETMSTKTCNCCKIEKPIACFYKNKSNKDGLHNRCKPCDVESGNKWKEKNYAKKYEYDKQFYHAQREKYDAMVLANHLSVEPAVYMIKNLINGKTYIGTSAAPYRRVKQHLSYHEDLEGKYPSNYELAFDVMTYGKKSFVWGVLEYTTKENKHSKEREYISIYQPEYNKNK
jgi:predicted GIY-YIG superfamily endonuclease